MRIQGRWWQNDGSQDKVCHTRQVLVDSKHMDMYIILTSQCCEQPGKVHFRSRKVGFTRVYILQHKTFVMVLGMIWLLLLLLCFQMKMCDMSLISAQNLDSEYNMRHF